MFPKRSHGDVVLTGEYNPKVDYDDICSGLSEVSGRKVWWEQHGDRVHIMTTSGHGKEVRDLALGVVMDYFFGRITDAMIREAVIRMN